MSIALIVIAVIAVLLIVLLFSTVKIAREYERGVIFRLGRLLPEPKGPGLFLLIPFIDRMEKVDLRTVTLNVPPQEVITKDNVPVRVNAVAYFRIVEPKAAIVQVENYMVATSQISQTTLRSVLGQHVLDELLSERDKINQILQSIIDEATSPWGIKVSIVEVKDVEIPSDMQRAMARQAEAERERRAKVISAEGEYQASERLKDAAAVMAQQPITVQLRYLQTLLEIGATNNSTIVFPIPIEFLETLGLQRKSRGVGAHGRRRRPRRARPRAARGGRRARAAAGRRGRRGPRTSAARRSRRSSEGLIVLAALVDRRRDRGRAGRLTCVPGDWPRQGLSAVTLAGVSPLRGQTPFGSASLVVARRPPAPGSRPARPRGGASRSRPASSGRSA